MEKTIQFISIMAVIAILACTAALCFVGCNSNKKVEGVEVGDLMSIEQTSEFQTITLEVSDKLSNEELWKQNEEVFSYFANL